jgi:hypothetical protein
LTVVFGITSGDHSSNSVRSRPKKSSHQRHSGGWEGVFEGGTGSRGGPELAELVKWRFCIMRICHLLGGFRERTS